MRRRALLLVLLALTLTGTLAALWAGGWLDFATLKAHHNQLATGVQAWPRLSALAFFVGYVVATGLSIPIATGLALLAGSLFSFGEALLLVSFASTTGATLSMLLARYILRDSVEKRWPSLIARTNRGLARDGLLYLLALRLAPAPPFFVVNLLMGMTRMPAGRFFIISQLGMLPLDLVFVNAGRALATLDAPADALDTDIMLALALASLLPLLMRRLIRSRLHHQ
jgi:uncharacterized membrane protein YdjX (TVP38/TMEM64 family)